MKINAEKMIEWAEKLVEQLTGRHCIHDINYLCKAIDEVTTEEIRQDKDFQALKRIIAVVYERYNYKKSGGNIAHISILNHTIVILQKYVAINRAKIIEILTIAYDLDKKVCGWDALLNHIRSRNFEKAQELIDDTAHYLTVTSGVRCIYPNSRESVWVLIEAGIIDLREEPKKTPDEEIRAFLKILPKYLALNKQLQGVINKLADFRGENPPINILEISKDLMFPNQQGLRQ